MIFFSSYQGATPEIYMRCIEDCVGTTVISGTELESFIQAYGQFYPSIEFTSEISEDHLTCLDGGITINDGVLSTSIYYKTTDKHAYLRYDSHHPKKCIPFLSIS